MPYIPLFSIQPEYSDLILSGSKTIELRKAQPLKAGVGSMCLIYATAPQKSIVGGFTIAAIYKRSIDELWELFSAKSQVPYDKFHAYYAGRSYGIAIEIKNPVRLKEPVLLSTVKGQLGRFYPPQGFRYLYENEIESDLFAKIVTEVNMSKNK